MIPWIEVKDDGHLAAVPSCTQKSGQEQHEKARRDHPPIMLSIIFPIRGTESGADAHRITKVLQGSSDPAVSSSSWSTSRPARPCPIIPSVETKHDVHLVALSPSYAEERSGATRAGRARPHTANDENNIIFPIHGTTIIGAAARWSPSRPDRPCPMTPWVEVKDDVHLAALFSSFRDEERATTEEAQQEQEAEHVHPPMMLSKRFPIDGTRAGAAG